MNDSTDQTQPLVEHLLELRRRLVWAVLGIAVCFCRTTFDVGAA